MKVIIAGATGLIGKALTDALQTRGDQVVALTRHLKSAQDILWDPSTGRLDPQAMEGADAWINLSGAPIAAWWTAAKKREILESRVKSTQLLAQTLAKVKLKPPVWINGSAIGFYGPQSKDPRIESSPAGEGFLAQVCQQWEAAASPAEALSVRLVLLRTGIVLSPKGGTLQKMHLPFKWGLGGVMGSGEQIMSWITLEDLVGAFLFALDNPLSGPINAASPYPVTNRQFTKTFGKVLNRPTFFPLPAPIARLILGQMADELLLSSIEAVPQALLQNGYTFKSSHLEPALESFYP